MSGNLIRFYRTPALSQYESINLLKKISERIKISTELLNLKTEFCFNIECYDFLKDNEIAILKWLLAETFDPQGLSNQSFLDPNNGIILEFGPRLNFTTAWSTNAVSICHACGIQNIIRIERSRRYQIISPVAINNISEIIPIFYDRMTECLYPEPIKTFQMDIKPKEVRIIPLIEEGPEALIKLNQELGLGMDEWDIDFYYKLFVEELKRNPTDVECFDLSQSNSEHSRHWFFKGKILIDNEEISKSLLQIVKEPYEKNPSNSIIAFKDNSSAIRGCKVKTILPQKTFYPSPFIEKELLYHLIFTAETHNFPSGVAPFPGAETGVGGRIRDVHATGRGGHVIAGTAAYCVGNLLIPNYPLPWEDSTYPYPTNLASPLQILIEASNGASDYGNKFGEPIIQGFSRSFGLILSNRERWEWIKPIMFTGGIGQIDSRHVEKAQPERQMLVVKIGGPAYRIGIGGGSASSMIQGENIEELDFNAVQRGDAEMEQKLNRVIRACIELGDENPIVSIHDQGAGGNCNVVKEIIYPAGAKIDIRKIILGDSTLSVLEIWGAEYQEQDAILIHQDKIDLLKVICEREKLPFSIIGEITGDGYIVLYDSWNDEIVENLQLQRVLGDMPQKVFKLRRTKVENEPFSLQEELPFKDILKRVLRLLSVGSKRFLTNKVDRSVTGLIAQQQCVGPLQLTLSNVAVVAQSHFPNEEGLYSGAAISIGEQPIKSLINPSAMARMCVAEALTNILWARISSLSDIKCSANWMWAPKLEGEGAKLYDAIIALKDLMIELGIAVDGGKDSLSMAARVRQPNGSIETVKSPPTLVISAYAPCPDVSKVITPDLKAPGKSFLIFIDISGGKNRLGGSALAQCFKQIGNQSPDIDNPTLLKNTFNAIQSLIDKGLILAGHDRSDGGLITTLLEMAFAGNCGLDIDIKVDKSFTKAEDLLALLFSEEAGVIIEYLPTNENIITSFLEKQGIPYQIIGKTTKNTKIRLNLFFSKDSYISVLDEDMRLLRQIWEETSFNIEMLQANPECAKEERRNIYGRKGPTYQLSFVPEETPKIFLRKDTKPSIAIIREEGSNGDREMASAFYQAGFETWDVMMTDLINKRITLDRFKGVAFVGGFSYADVLGAAKGWAGTIRFNELLKEEFEKFYLRDDTFSLGVCNGCQLMSLLGWIPWSGISSEKQPRFIRNKSGRFESRFSTVKILKSPSIMLEGMEGSILGIWVAHGEGRLFVPEEDMLIEILRKDLAPIRYVDDNGESTEKYPFNPNGSPYGIAALCSLDGRHLAMMPHPERTFLKWQWAWMPLELRENLKTSPWLKMFQNARRWCDSR
ncbi:MAG: phosphoribosylformylglycinamidine synthase [Thermodesulfovibrionales bacterium]|nr:phosphoribosylformylglycinamidine synthase [Thermodesulfovibrionales bacterium]